MLKLLVLALIFCVKTEQEKSKETIDHTDIVHILEEASRIKVPDVKQIRDSKDTGSIQPAAPPPPPNLPEPPAF